MPWRNVCFGLMLALICPAFVAAQPKPPADLVLRNAAVYTVDAARRWAESVAVREGRIVYVGHDSGVAEWIGPSTRVFDLRGKMVLPGFHDVHVHLTDGGIELDECRLHELADETQILAAVKKYAELHPERKWIRGGGWQLPLFPDAQPHKSLLDKVVPDRPVLLDSADGHSSWANSRALEIGGITKETPDPPRGRIERDPKTGEPTGTLREAAIRVVLQHVPPYSPDEYVNGLRRGMKLANSFGITSIQEASVSEDILKAYADLDGRNELTVRAVTAMRVLPDKTTAQIPQLVEWRQKYAGRRVRATAVKIFADGVIESRTAALLEPYVGHGDDRGRLNLEPEVLNPLVTALDRAGFQIHIHAIGDRAIRSSLDALEFARARNGSRDSRHHLAHIQLFTPQDIPRFRQLGTVANFQPFWMWEDPYIVKLTLPVLGPERSRWLYPMRSIANTGAIIACGSDWSVSSLNPLDAIQVGITRRELTAGPGKAWLPEETIDLPTMLAGYTINGAYVNFEEQETGSIEVGKLADFIVLDRNLFDVPPHEIHREKVLFTFVEGKEVYRAP